MGVWHVIDVAEGCKVKRILVTPGARLSLQSHKHRSEHWMVIQGEAYCEVDGVESLVRHGESIDVVLEVRHRLGNLASVSNPVGFEYLKVEPTCLEPREVGAPETRHRPVMLVRREVSGPSRRSPRRPRVQQRVIRLHRTRSAMRGSHGAPHLGVAGHAALPGEVRRPRRPALHERRDACLG